MKYCQCELSKKTENGEILDVAWIPKEFAKKNKYLKIRINGGWDNGWQVVKTGNILSSEYIYEREYKTHRIITDK